MEFKPLLLVLGLVVQSQQQGTTCATSQIRMLRLQRWSPYSGTVEICWKDSFATQYTWQPVCNRGWTDTVAEAVCRSLNISSTSSGRE